MMVRFYPHPDRGPCVEFGFYKAIPQFCMSAETAARLLAGLEVALGKALEDAGHGKCLHCGKVRTTGPCTTRCCYCHGVLAPAGKDGGA